MKYILDPIKNTFNFAGNSTIKEFWIFFLFYVIIIIPIQALFIVYADLKNTPWAIMIKLLTYLPMLGLGIRRVNETRLNKWLFLIPFVNLILALLPADSKNLQKI